MSGVEVLSTATTEKKKPRNIGKNTKNGKKRKDCRQDLIITNYAI